MRATTLVLCVLLCACKPTLPPQQTYEQIRAEVDKGGPYVTAVVEEVHKDLFKGAATKGLLATEPAPFDGLLLNPQAWALYSAFKTDRDKFRTELEIEKKRAAVEAVLTTQTIAGLRYQLNSSSTWWSRNKGIMGFAIGTTLGMAITTAIVYALTRGKAIETSTGALRAFPHHAPLLRW
jgi:hypothetical protein